VNTLASESMRIADDDAASSKALPGKADGEDGLAMKWVIGVVVIGLIVGVPGSGLSRRAAAGRFC